MDTKDKFKFKFGIKAYGKWHNFKTLKEYRSYLMEWIMFTDGSEQSRAINALTNLENGINFTDTDIF